MNYILIIKWSESSK